MRSGTSIVIPALNEEAYLPRLLESLQQISSPLDIIVVDGASTDGTRDVVQEFQKVFTGESSLTLVESAERGISLQKNLGAARAKYERLMFCDADTVFGSREDFETLVSTCDAKAYAIAGPVLKSLEPGLLRSMRYLGMALAQRMLVRFGKPYFFGACQVTTKSVFAASGGFDTECTLGEDIDFSIRAAQHGSFGIVSVPLLVSDRRFMKYGFMWIIFDVPNLYRLLRYGKVNPDTMYYPFGAYGDEAAHFATKKTSR